jgi:hypothetical protein
MNKDLEQMTVCHLQNPKVKAVDDYGLKTSFFSVNAWSFRHKYPAYMNIKKLLN